MAEEVVLHGYRFSVYTWIARMVLHEKGVVHDQVEVDPFAADLSPAYAELHPFGRVPVLVHAGFKVYETAAIARYVDLAFDGPNLTPKGAGAQARMAQVIGIADAYAYWPMVRQVFAHRVFSSISGDVADEAQVLAGLVAAERVLAALEPLLAEAQGAVTLADCHLAPMLGYFAMAPEGRAALERAPAVRAWWERVAMRPAYLVTQPLLG